MLPVIAGFIAGLVLGMLTFLLLQGGLVGLAVGAVVAVLAYVGVSMLVERPRKIGDLAAESVPDGDKVVRTLDEANQRVHSIGTLASKIRDQYVGKEAADFIAATNDLIRYVNTDPGAYQTLRHYINVYGEQTEDLLGSYVDVERSSASAQLNQARFDTIQALRALERTAAGELRRAVETKTLALAADSDAIVRLASMDGYDEGDERSADLAAATGASKSANAHAVPDGSTAGDDRDTAIVDLMNAANATEAALAADSASAAKGEHGGNGGAEVANSAKGRDGGGQQAANTAMTGEERVA